MVDIKTAIHELNTGKCYLTSKSEEPNFCTTEGELVILLKRLEEFNKLGLEAEEIWHLIDLVGAKENVDLISENKMLKDYITSLKD